LCTAEICSQDDPDFNRIKSTFYACGNGLMFDVVRV
jgi:hypothetical protein